MNEKNSLGLDKCFLDAANLPVKIIWRDNNRISIFDPVTNWQADLMGFGADNARAFAELLAKATKGE